MTARNDPLDPSTVEDADVNELLWVTCVTADVKHGID